MERFKRAKNVSVVWRWIVSRGQVRHLRLHSSVGTHQWSTECAWLCHAGTRAILGSQFLPSVWNKLTEMGWAIVCVCVCVCVHVGICEWLAAYAFAVCRFDHDTGTCVCVNAITHMMGSCSSSASLARNQFSIHVPSFLTRLPVSQNLHMWSKRPQSSLTSQSVSPEESYSGATTNPWETGKVF